MLNSWNSIHWGRDGAGDKNENHFAFQSCTFQSNVGKPQLPREPLGHLLYNPLRFLGYAGLKPLSSISWMLLGTLGNISLACYLFSHQILNKSLPEHPCLFCAIVISHFHVASPHCSKLMKNILLSLISPASEVY